MIQLHCFILFCLLSSISKINPITNIILEIGSNLKSYSVNSPNNTQGILDLKIIGVYMIFLSCNQNFNGYIHESNVDSIYHLIVINRITFMKKIDTVLQISNFINNSPKNYYRFISGGIIQTSSASSFLIFFSYGILKRYC